MIVGAGVAGASAAIRAFERDVYVKLVEKAFAPFLVQASCATRWIDPAQYDWPADHWLSAQYDWAPPAMPLRFRADWANVLASGWTKELKQLAALKTFIDYVEDTECVDVYPDDSTSDRLIAEFYPDNGPEPFPIIIWAGGFGDELSRLRDPTGKVIYEGMPFWKTDQFTTPACGAAPAKLGGPPPKIEVVIAGGGDGALQDLLRIVTHCKSAVEFYKKIPIPAQIEEQIYSPSDRCERNWIWGSRALHDHALHVQLEDAHQDLVERCWVIPCFEPPWTRRSRPTFRGFGSSILANT